MPDRNDDLELFAVTAPGLEALCAAELARLGIAAAVEPGGVAWSGSLAELYAANLELRTATRVLVRVGEFDARSFSELERHARRLAWERFVGRRGRAVTLRVTSRRSKLYHERAIAQRVLEAIDRQAGPLGPSKAGGGSEEEDAASGAAGATEDPDAQLFVVRFLRDRCTISADASGLPLHRRGYRQAVAKAPLRETLAAAMLLGSGWPADVPLLDPLCGSGTLAIEGALLGRRIAPGLAAAGGTPRGYAFEAWADFDAGVWEELVGHARDAVLPAAGIPIHASDRDTGAIEAARANAARAGVLDDITFEARALSAVEAPGPAGWLVTNPPYGQRVGEQTPLRDLYAALGNLARRRLAGWTLALLSADRRLDAQLGVRLDEVLRTSNGGIPVRLMVGRVDELRS
jgi:putative N6-adenine-specific DNA methylase